MDLIARALIFGGILAAPSSGVPYLVFLSVGTAIWIFFERGLLWATRSIEMNRRLVNQVYFPRLTLWLASTFPAIVEFLLYLAIAVGFIAVYSIVDGHLYLNLSPDLLLAVPAAALCLGLFLGIGLWTSVLGARTRDMRFVVRYASSFWYFLTPVVIPLSQVPENYRAIVEWNPATPPVEMFKLALLDRGTVTLGPLLVCVALVVVLWTSGMVFYSRVEAAALDRL
jgi:lipopolysaccharide transport system permease protein